MDNLMNKAKDAMGNKSGGGGGGATSNQSGGQEDYGDKGIDAVRYIPFSSTIRCSGVPQRSTWTMHPSYSLI